MSRFINYLYDPSDPQTPEKIQKDIPEFKFKCPDIDKLIIYTIFTYDPHADLLKLFPNDFNKRKREAATLAGFKLNSDGVFDEWAEDCIVGQNNEYNAAIVAFVTKFNIVDFPAYVMYREIFFSEFRVAMFAHTSKAKKDAMANVETARKQIADLEKKLFTDEETVNVRSALYVVAEKMKLNLRPEDKAKEIKDKKIKVTDPYYGPKRRPGRPRKTDVG